ncbi:unnamed protein product [Angiostrongylus costaricensis]|uniref:Uncharacterized protein n=1 Tax=Angiostrongylus costaricensis TaxID=334426 RepID=A0A0R3PDQ0_ANGCS|nr:unnamed protein product [Angiostrongylus costaricensis]
MSLIKMIPERVDLPVKKLEDLSRARMKCARHLLKIDFKKEECINLWKLCNIYSATAVDVDNAMRDIRNALRKRLKTKDAYRDLSAFRRLIDEYRPTKKTVDHQEVYDKPTSKEKQRWLELNMFGKKKEEKKSIDNYAAIGKKTKVEPKLEKNGKQNILVTVMDEPAKSNMMSSRIEYESQMKFPAVPPTRLCSFQPTTPPLPHPPPTIRVANNKSHTGNNKFNMAPSRSESLERNGSTNSPSKSEREDSEMYDVPTFLLTDGYEVPSEHSDNTLLSAQLNTQRIYPSNTYQPIAPPRLNALKAKIATEVQNQNRGTQSISNITKLEESRKNADITRSNSKRRGVLAKQHSIKIDSNSTRQAVDIQRMETNCLAISDEEFAIVVNRL